MCDIGTALFLASTAATAASVVGQQQQANAQVQFQEELGISQNKQAAIQSTVVRDRQAQEREIKGRESFKAKLEADAAKATAVTAAGEAGVNGNSVDALLQEFGLQEARFQESLLRQEQFDDANAESEIEAIRSGASSFNTQLSRPVAQPNYIGAALRIGTDALQLRQDRINRT